MRTALLCIALAVLALPPSVHAQSLPLTESQALSRLSPDSPRLRAIRGAVDVARAEALGAARWPNPRVIFDRESVAGVTENITMVGQTLPITGRRGLEMQAATALVGATSERSNETIRRARADLRLAFAQLVAAQARERELTAAGERLAELANILAKREAAGDAAGFDRLRAEREVLELEADRSAASTERARAQAILSSFFTDTTDTTQILAVDQTAPLAPVPTLDALVERAESVRGELLALRKDIDAAHFSARAADRRRMPEPEIVAGTKSSSPGTGDLGGVVTIQALIPLFDRGRPERALAVARASQAEAQIDAFRLALRSEIAALRATVLERRTSAARYRAAAVDGAGQIERIAQVSYEAGERGILELLDAYRIGFSARLRQVGLEFAVRQCELELEFVSGWEISE